MQGLPYRAHRAPLLALVAVGLLLACSGPSAQPASAPVPAKPAGSGTAAPAAAPAAPAAPGAGVAAKPGPLRQTELGVVALVSYMYPMWVGVEKGFFPQQGLNVEITTLQTNEAVAALVSGSLDVLMCPTDGCVTAVSKGGQIRLVNDYLTEAPYNLMARQDTPTIADVRGKKVGVSSLSTGSGTLARIMLTAQGLGPDDYQLVQAGGNPSRYAALQSGGVDVALLSDPANFEAILSGYRNLLEFSKVVPQYSFSSNWVLNDWLTQAGNPDVLVRFQAGQMNASRWAREPANKAALLELIMKHTNTSAEIAERVYDYYIIQNPGVVGVDDLRTEPVESVLRILREEGTVTDMPPTAQWRDGSYIQQARQLAGR
jgi:ABC-type nitrate/sulfonate/bicarbonate transport system substrate-binding protein